MRLLGYLFAGLVIGYFLVRAPNAETVCPPTVQMWRITL